MIGRVPVAAQEDGKTACLKPVNVIPQDRENFIAAADAKNPTWEEIILDIRKKQGISSCQSDFWNHRRIKKLDGL